MRTPVILSMHSRHVSNLCPLMCYNPGAILDSSDDDLPSMDFASTSGQVQLCMLSVQALHYDNVCVFPAAKT